MNEFTKALDRMFWTWGPASRELFFMALVLIGVCVTAYHFGKDRGRTEAFREIWMEEDDIDEE